MQAHFLEHKGVKIIMDATPETAYLAKVQFDALKWQMARLNPKVYSERVNPEINVQTTVHNHISSDLLKQIRERRDTALHARN